MIVPILRDYQLNYTQKTKELFSQNIQKILLVMPTGTGKTTVFSSLSKDWLSMGSRVLIAVHRIELVDQIVERLATFDIQAGVMAGDEPFYPELPVQVGMIQSLFKYSDWIPEYIVVDECHHSVAKTYLGLWERYPHTKILGVTATPVRLDGKGFSDLYEAMLNLYPLDYFFEKGYLVRPIHYFCGELPPSSLRDISSGGDYSLSRQTRHLVQSKALTSVVETYQRYSPGKKAVVFAASIQHSKMLTEEFQARGISAAHLDGDVEKGLRKKIIDGFRSGLYQVLLNFDLISEGFDCPDIDSVLIARRTKSLSTYIQIVGRCLRPDPKAGKEFGYVLDCSGQWLEHGFAGLDYPWQLDMSKEDIVHFVGKQKLFVNKKKNLKTILDSPQELLGVNLVQAERDILRASMYEKYLNDLIPGDEAAITPDIAYEAFLHYVDWMEVCGNTWALTEFYYLQNRLKQFGASIPEGMKKELLEAKHLTDHLNVL